MRTKDIKLIIDKDLDRNKDIKNHLFFCIFRFGNSFINGNTIFDRICSIIESRPFVIHRQVQGIDLEPQECIRFLPLL